MISATLAFRELQKPTADNSRKYTQMNNTRDDLDHTKNIRSIVADLIIIYIILMWQPHQFRHRRIRRIHKTLLSYTCLKEHVCML